MWVWFTYTVYTKQFSCFLLLHCYSIALELCFTASPIMLVICIHTKKALCICMYYTRSWDKDHWMHAITHNTLSNETTPYFSLSNFTEHPASIVTHDRGAWSPLLSSVVMLECFFPPLLYPAQVAHIDIGSNVIRFNRQSSPITLLSLFGSTY